MVFGNVRVGSNVDIYYIIELAPDLQPSCQQTMSG